MPRHPPCALKNLTKSHKNLRCSRPLYSSQPTTRPTTTTPTQPCRHARGPRKKTPNPHPHHTTTAARQEKTVRAFRTQQRATHPPTPTTRSFPHPPPQRAKGRTHHQQPAHRQATNLLMFHPEQPRAPHSGAPRGHQPHQPHGPDRVVELLRKEVIQPHLPVRLPCYDLVPITSPTFDSSLPQGVGPPASGVTDFRDLTGGVYKARERIHRSVADLRLLATPTSWGRVADPNPN